MAVAAAYPDRPQAQAKLAFVGRRIGFLLGLSLSAGSVDFTALSLSEGWIGQGWISGARVSRGGRWFIGLRMEHQAG